MQPSVLIVTENGVELECSTSAPIPTKEHGYLNAPSIQGLHVPTMINGVKEWSKVVEVRDIGEIMVQNITVENEAFWAGKFEGKYILHHNEKKCNDPYPNNCSLDSWQCCCA
jgi:hypothetical protein